MSRSTDGHAASTQHRKHQLPPLCQYQQMHSVPRESWHVHCGPGDAPRVALNFKHRAVFRHGGPAGHGRVPRRDRGQRRQGCVAHAITVRSEASGSPLAQRTVLATGPRASKARNRPRAASPQSRKSPAIAAQPRSIAHNGRMQVLTGTTRVSRDLRWVAALPYGLRCFTDSTQDSCVDISPLNFKDQTMISSSA
jgi:hypothetical protein